MYVWTRIILVAIGDFWDFYEFITRDLWSTASSHNEIGPEQGRRGRRGPRPESAGTTFQETNSPAKLQRISLSQLVQWNADKSSLPFAVGHFIRSKNRCSDTYLRPLRAGML